MPRSTPPRLRLAVLIACAACGTAPQPDAPRADSIGRDSARVTVEPAPVLPPAPVPGDSVRRELRSVWTSLRAEECTTISVDEESGGSTQRCPGTAGYTLLALEGDARMSITVRTPRGAEHPLELWTTATGAFSSLGPRAEWRVRGEGGAAVPVALVVELLAHEHPDDPERITPYRIIARLGPAASCVTHRLPGDTPDAEVRRLADASAGHPCRTSYSEPA